LFNKASSVNFFAVGQTGELTKICVDNFYALNSKFTFLNFPNTVSHKIAHTQNEIFFFVSLSGETKAVLNLASQAKEKQHLVISLTHLVNNSLANLADINLFCYTQPETIDGYNITDKTPLMIILHSLFKRYLVY
jgi:DNA-binding MurR/RpiR family transcriptional regulator